MQDWKHRFPQGNIHTHNNIVLTVTCREAEQQRQVADLDAQVKKALEERERSEREREAARGDAEQERKKLSGLLADLEDDALSYSVSNQYSVSYV